MSENKNTNDVVTRFIEKTKELNSYLWKHHIATTRDDAGKKLSLDHVYFYVKTCHKTTNNTGQTTAILFENKVFGKFWIKSSDLVHYISKQNKRFHMNQTDSTEPNHFTLEHDFIAIKNTELYKLITGSRYDLDAKRFFKPSELKMLQNDKVLTSLDDSLIVFTDASVKHQLYGGAICILDSHDYSILNTNQFKNLELVIFNEIDFGSYYGLTDNLIKINEIEYQSLKAGLNMAITKAGEADSASKSKIYRRIVLQSDSTYALKRLEDEVLGSVLNNDLEIVFQHVPAQHNTLLNDSRSQLNQICDAGAVGARYLANNGILYRLEQPFTLKIASASDLRGRIRDMIKVHKLQLHIRKVVTTKSKPTSRSTQTQSKPK